jgi:CubicO group peptidase (beta-lactamase class C family)
VPVPWFDLASLAKPLVTAPLALAKLDLDLDRRPQLGFERRPGPLTVRQLLSHSAGLPPWLPFTGEPLARQLERGFPAGAHPKLQPGTPGVSLYSDLGYRLLAELLELESGRPFAVLGAENSGLAAAPWPSAPPFAPQGPDAEMWRLAEPALAFPARDPYLPNDANARAGMRGHAGFAASPPVLRAALRRWLASGLPARMAVDAARGADGSRWGLGLQRALTGPGRFGQLLAALPPGIGGLHLLVQNATTLSPPAPALAEPPGEPSPFWFHLGFTGPALFFRPRDGMCVALLAHRVGPSGELLDAEQLRARRWEVLAAEVARLQRDHG